MLTRYETKVTVKKNKGEGWLEVVTEEGRNREWHITDMIPEGNESEKEKAMIQKAYDELRV